MRIFGLTVMSALLCCVVVQDAREGISVDAVSVLRFAELSLAVNHKDLNSLDRLIAHVRQKYG